MRPHPWTAALLVLLASCGSSSAQSAGGSSSVFAPGSSTGSASSTTSGSTTPGSTTSASSTTASSATTPPPAPTACGPAGAPTLAADGRVRVYVVHQVVYGCSVGHRRSFRLGHATRSIAESVVGPVTVAGDVAAYGLRKFGVDTLSASVVVSRLTDGARLGQFPATRTPGAESFQSVASLVVRADGAVAWIASERSIIGGRRSVTEVHAAGAGGDRVLDSGPRIDAASLRLHGTVLSWSDGGAARHATLR